MKAIITVVGPDRVGIIAEVCTLLAELHISVVEISQTIMDGYFTMMMVTDLAACEASFEAVSETLQSYGEQTSLSIRIQREDMFDAMYKL